MGFNGIDGTLNQPGIVPWPIMVLYFSLASIFLLYVGRKNGALSQLKTVDYVYTGIAAAFMIVWNFFVGPFMDKLVPSGASAFLGFGALGEFMILLILAGVVRKVGIGMLGWFIYNILADIYHYGFGGQPMYIIYQVFAFGILIDLWIAITHGKPFGFGSEKTQKAQNKNNETTKVPLRTRAMPIIAGIVIGIPWAIDGPLFFGGFFAPLLYGGIVDWQAIVFGMFASIPSFVLFGIIGSFLAVRVSKVVG